MTYSGSFAVEWYDNGWQTYSTHSTYKSAHDEYSEHLGTMHTTWRLTQIWSVDK